MIIKKPKILYLLVHPLSQEHGVIVDVRIIALFVQKTNIVKHDMMLTVSVMHIDVRTPQSDAEISKPVIRILLTQNSM